MSQATIEKPGAAAEPLGPSFRLSGLLILVLAAGLSLGVMSRAHVRMGPAGAFWETSATRWLGVALTPIGVTLCLTLAIQAFGRLNHRNTLKKEAWPVCWRIAALALLASLLAEESSLLSLVSSGSWSANRPPGAINPLTLDARLRLLPPVLGLMIVGLVLGMRPRRVRPAPQRRRLAAWARSVLAVLGGILIVAELMIIPYLVLIAIEAAQNARMHPGEASGGLLTSAPKPPLPPGLAGRLDATIPTTSLALLVILITTGWVSSASRRTDENQQARRSWRDLFVGLVLTVACLGAGFCLDLRTFPSVQPVAFEGLGMTFGVWECGVIVLGFGCFAMGLVANLLVPHVDNISGRPWFSFGCNRHAALMGQALAALALLLVIRSSLGQITGHWGATGRSGASSGLWTWLQDNDWISDGSIWFPALVIPWLAWRSIGLLLRAGHPVLAPFDRLFDSSVLMRRFVGYACALWALLLAALPALTLAGLVVLHHALGYAP